ncbi:MAG: creatininase family protein [Melioribacteraceae bacterium]|nr:creatininase family protein [Melioribacteraceae bacterium]MCF8354987.1 creatininase family protein [Melioribacteraceae bacterium]MCF8394312.1 creatininase family protein [Melioribacteraceae bacterium]MCF8419991.1 creatininase family protein [Melioribacteraceae bacterium]
MINEKNDPLSILEVFDVLEVGPVKLSKDRISAPYKIINNGKEDTTELIYSYEENVFDPADNSSINLASMIASQVAVNYGLFCKKIIFKGIYDHTDQRFLSDAVENTAREIYVKKIIEHNPFLTGEAAKLPVVKQKNYSRAILEFPDIDPEPVKTKWEYWSTGKDSHCILSSGGKDSLLSYGLINELGYETHPLFVNESGRHWFTALNAYRYFKENIPNTGRVWVNSDRVFPWMLRHMPFIRKDFQDIRADEYPIRLWTVAVFLFGILPLMKKRGIGRMIIGDEYDTTMRKNYKGITHYDGLYDQSKFFDEAMSRYYMRKGWSISQFSILRPLSEMMIETILTKRYPRLQAHQVSCHAAHKEGDRIYPCGKCEKCRRIVGMLTAINEDPKHCGYNDEQINKALKLLETKWIHQETVSADHLLHTLSEMGKITLDDKKKKKVKEKTEILHLRFDTERSPMIAIPQNLRKSLYKIYMEYALGALRKVGRKWQSVNPLKDPAIEEKYPFELAGMKTDTKIRREIRISQKTHLWAEQSWPELEERLKETDIAILPVGSIEQHGPHLPVDVDAFDADYLAKRVAEACSDPKPLVLPLVPYGVAYHHDDFKGTISVTNNSLSNFIYDIGMAAARNGIKKILIINGHGDNAPTLSYAAQMINRDAGIFIAVDTGETSDVDIDDISETPNDVHAGEIETSTTLAVRPHLVHIEKSGSSILNFSSRYLNFSSLRGVPWYAQTKKISESGVMGDPKKASVEKGNKIWGVMIAHLVSFVEDLKAMSLDEIHQKKY